MKPLQRPKTNVWRIPHWFCLLCAAQDAIFDFSLRVLVKKESLELES